MNKYEEKLSSASQAAWVVSRAARGASWAASYAASSASWAARMFSTTAQLDFLIELKADAIKKLDKIKSAKRV